MEQANTYFILADVADHILANFRTFDNTVLFNFRHKDDNAPNRLQVQVTRQGKNFIVSYDAEYNGKQFTQGASDPIPGDMVQTVIAEIVNDTIPEV